MASEKTLLTTIDYQNIAEEVRKVLTDDGCPLRHKEDREAVLHLYGMFRDYGEGDTSKGIRKFRALISFVDGMQSKKNVVTGIMFAVITAGIVGWFVRVVALGVVDFFRDMAK